MRRTVALGGTVAVLVTGCGGQQPGAQRSPESPSPAAEETGLPADCVDVSSSDATVEATDNEFEPLCLGLAPGQDVTVTNVGIAKHSFTIRGTDIDIDLEPGEEATAEGVGDVVPEGEEIEFYCTYHPSMVGYLNLVVQ